MAKSLQSHDVKVLRPTGTPRPAGDPTYDDEDFWNADGVAEPLDDNDR